ncbi:ESX secretion-associated protein EspG [Saccharomonospora xinjiangensis]|uniref:ESX secretion-associated protein EspG n=1 Tax=Saccharomonospora xinjiangensis TaxID=75294 RepID=UPI001070096C|nr:ESX secretion-associated protein EspG [Saccharomonospora xinjiangensis]QBQ61553.1 hypothetical protein EYD13_16040 [Saccharomonospora xinjiangensis]
MSESFEFVLGSVEADIVGQALGVDVRRAPLRVRNTTTDPARRIRLTAIVGQRLADRRLSTSTALHPSLRTAFGLFANFRVSVSISGIDGFGSPIAVLALTDGSQALGVTQNSGADELLFSLFSDDELVEVLAGVLPPMPPAEGSAVTVRGSAVEHTTAWEERKAAERAEDEEETSAFGNLQVVGTVAAPRPQRRGHRPGDEDRLRLALSGKRLGGGHITVTRSAGAEPRALSWLDTEQGRYLVHDRRGNDEFLATYEPASRADVASAVRDVLARAY